MNNTKFKNFKLMIAHTKMEILSYKVYTLCAESVH